jgi:hypothetical protein
MEKRGGALIDVSKEDLASRMKRYFDPDASFEDLQNEEHPLAKDAARFDARKARPKIQLNEGFKPDQIVRYALRPLIIAGAISPLFARFGTSLVRISGRNAGGEMPFSSQDSIVHKTPKAVRFITRAFSATITFSQRMHPYSRFALIHFQVLAKRLITLSPIFLPSPAPIWPALAFPIPTQTSRPPS